MADETRGRKAQAKADIEALQRLVIGVEGVVDYSPLISYVMRKCGCTYSEIGKVFNVHRTTAEYYTKAIEIVLK